jgi:hypothetical protein
VTGIHHGQDASSFALDWDGLRRGRITVLGQLAELGYVKPVEGSGTRNSSGWCPLHGATGEHHPSFSVMVTDDGQDRVHCFAGCDQAELFTYITENLRAGTLPRCEAKLPPGGGGWGRGGGSSSRRISEHAIRSEEDYARWCWQMAEDDFSTEVAFHIYHDEHGEPVTAASRWSDKQFIQHRWERGGWVAGLRKGTGPEVRPLYHSDRIAADPEATVWAV